MEAYVGQNRVSAREISSFVQKLFKIRLLAGTINEMTTGNVVAKA